jgi:hypothetical protein
MERHDNFNYGEDIAEYGGKFKITDLICGTIWQRTRYK